MPKYLRRSASVAAAALVYLGALPSPAQKGSPANAAPPKPNGTSQRPAPTGIRAAPRGALVPPPPPVIPMAGGFTFVSGMPLELLSKDELEKRKLELESQYAKTSRLAEQRQLGALEKRKRAELFVSLYKEGVVSKRELEGAERAADEAESDCEEYARKAGALKEDIQRIDARLKDLQKPVGDQASGKPPHIR